MIDPDLRADTEYAGDPSTDTVIHVDELLLELADMRPCQDCAGGLGLLVESNGDWHVIQLHDVPCVAMASKA